MNEQTTTIREFLRNFKKLDASKKTIIVENHGKPTGVYVPYEIWHYRARRKKITIADIEKFSFGGGDPNLSQKIDEIVYGAPNPYRKKK